MARNRGNDKQISEIEQEGQMDNELDTLNDADRVDDSAVIQTTLDGMAAAQKRLEAKKAPKEPRAVPQPKERSLTEVVNKQEHKPGIERYEQIARHAGVLVKAGASPEQARLDVMDLVTKRVDQMLDEWDQMGGVPLVAQKGFAERHGLVTTRALSGKTPEELLASLENDSTVWHEYRLVRLIKDRTAAGQPENTAREDVLGQANIFVRGILAEWEASGRPNMMTATKAYFAQSYPDALKLSDARNKMLAAKRGTELATK